MSHAVRRATCTVRDVPTAQRSDDYIPALTYDRLTALYDPVIQVGTRERLSKARLVEQAGLSAGMRVLDVGCGTGTLAVMLKERHPGVEVAGLDGDPEVLERGRRKAASAGLAIDFVQGMSFDLPFEDGSFDRVLSSLMLHHLKRDAKERTAREIARVLRPGGELHVADFGPQPGAAMWLASRSVRYFDGGDVTADNYAGRLPEIFSAAGLLDVRERGRMRTAFGSMSFYSARA